MSQTKAAIGVLGAGAWGTALAVLLARNGYPALLWSNDPAALDELARTRRNARYLPEAQLSPAISAQPDIRALARETEQFLIAVPSHAFRATLSVLAPHIGAGATLAWATKGLEPGTGKLLSEVLREVLHRDARYGVISGPTFAGEVAKGLPSAVCVASHTPDVAAAIAAWLRNDHMRVYTSDDVAGVQLGGAIKNVIAIAAGISDGLGFGANARAALITRGLAELTRLGMARGGRRETFMGLSGVGDLVLTCTDNASRNRRVGLGLGQGRALKTVLAEIGQATEGVATAREVHQLALRLGVDMPITEQVYRVLYEQVPPLKAVETLFSREPRQEAV